MSADSKTKGASVERRGFLKVLGIGAGAAAAGVAADGAASPAAASENRNERTKARYRATAPMCRPSTARTLLRRPRDADQEKRTSARRISLAAALGAQSGGVMDRRSFLRRSGLVAGGAAAVGALSLGAVRKAEAAGGGMGKPDLSKPIEIRKNMCTHCSVGCSVIAEVHNGVWGRPGAGVDSPINRGTHCAKGARSARRSRATAA